MKKVVKYLISLILAIIIVLFVQTFVIVGHVIPNNDMSPTLNKGDRVIVNKIKVTFNQLNNGDIITYRRGNEIYTSRIIAKPGQSMAFCQGQLYRDDRPVDASYAKNRKIKDFSLRNFKELDGDIIPPNNFVVLNDHDNNQHDSRQFGLIDKKDIIGNISLRYYPFQNGRFSSNLKRGVKIEKELLEWIISIAVAFVILFIVGKFIVTPYTIKGESMDPTLKDGERVAVNIIGYKTGGLEKGNVVVFHANKNDDYVKRVIGVPGDKVEYKNDTLYVNGKKQDEPYLNYNLKHKQGDYITGTFQVKDLPNANPKSNVIPKGKYLVLGDNREVSKDSRAFGLIDEDQIVGKVSFRFWPFSEFKHNFNPENTKN